MAISHGDGGQGLVFFLASRVERESFALALLRHARQHVVLLGTRARPLTISGTRTLSRTARTSAAASSGERFPRSGACPQGGASPGRAEFVHRAAGGGGRLAQHSIPGWRTVSIHRGGATSVISSAKTGRCGSSLRRYGAADRCRAHRHGPAAPRPSVTSRMAPAHFFGFSSKLMRGPSSNHLTQRQRGMLDGRQVLDERSSSVQMVSSAILP